MTGSKSALTEKISPPAIPAARGDDSGAAGGELVGETPKYRVFLSYSHADVKWARWLMRRLEGYAVPARLRNRAAPIGVIGARLAPVFRDRDEMPTASDLGATIRRGLAQSATLVVICSPKAASSRWVNEEILAFKRLGRVNQVFAFIVAGEPSAAPADGGCFPPALSFALGPDGQPSAAPAELVAADARPQGDGRDDAFTRLVAGLLGVGFDDLRRRELQRRHKHMTWIAVGSAAGMAITLGLGSMAWKARDDARRHQEQGEKLVTFMLGDMRAQVEKVGKVEALEKIAVEAMAYFNSLGPHDLTDAALAEQVKALRQLGEVQVLQLRYREAHDAFTAALERASTLVERHPRDGDLIFERGQAEYWIGYVPWKQGYLSAAREWFTRYRDTGVALETLDPGRKKWQSELAWGLHNLAVLDLKDDRLDAARRGLQAEQAILSKVAAANPADLEIQSRLADVQSWLGSVAERAGELAEAGAQLNETVLRFEGLTRTDPGAPRWRARLADSLGLHASLLAITGQASTAFARRKQATVLLDALVAADPQNRSWLTVSLYFRLKEARLALADGDVNRATALVREALPSLVELFAAAPSDHDLTSRLANAFELQAELHLAAGHADAAAVANRAIDLLDTLIGQGRANGEDFGDAARMRMVAGRIAAQSGDPAAALRHWGQASELVAPRVAHTGYWRVLDPAARVFALTGRLDESRAIIQRLQDCGYRPLEPWPAADAPDLPVSNINPQSK